MDAPVPLGSSSLSWAEQGRKFRRTKSVGRGQREERCVGRREHNYMIFLEDRRAVRTLT